MLMRVVFWSIFTSALLAALTGCGWGDPSFVRLGDYECPAAATWVRHVVATTPYPAPTVPKDYTLVKSRTPTPVDPAFLKQFADMGKTFISAEAVSWKENLGFPQNPRNGLAPFIVHIRHMKKMPDGGYEIQGGWAYKLQSESRVYRVSPEGKVSVLKDQL
jgi:hypothetical protein